MVKTTAMRVLHEVIEPLVPGQLLPPLSQLAKQYHIPGSLLRDCANQLVRRGKLLRRGRGYVRPDTNPRPPTTDRVSDRFTFAAPQPQSAPRKWQRIRDRIHADLVQGVYPIHTNLPSLQELAERYGANYRTLRKAITDLEKRNLLVAGKRTFRSPTIATRCANQVHCIVRGLEGIPVATTARSEEHYRLLEFEAMRLGIEVVVEPYSYEQTTLYNTHHQPSPSFTESQLSRILGFMIWTGGLGATFINDTVRKLLPYNKPVCIFDEAVDFPPHRLKSSSHRVRHFSVANSHIAGYELGRYLREKGHREVAFFSPYHKYPWSQWRLDGLREALGPDSRVEPFCFQLERQQMEGPWSNFSHAFEELLREYGLGSAVNPTSMKAIQAISSQTHMLHEQWQNQALRASFDQALTDRAFTAWVGVSDPVALQIIQYLRSRHCHVPRDCAVAGFDNNLEALFFKLTSYSFNGPAVIPAMFNHILSPPAPHRAKKRSQPLTIKGMVIPRETA